MYTLTEEGKEYLERGLPEKNLVELLSEGPVSFDLLKKRMKHFSIAMQWTKKKGWIAVKDGKIHLLKEPKAFPEQEALERIAKGEYVSSEMLSLLLQRRLIERARKIEKEINFLTEDHIKTGDWRLGKFKPYNVEVSGEKIYPGKKHIVSFYIQKIRDIFFDLGFREANGPMIESGFWNFDALFVPQDHPGRELQDTFYMKVPEKCLLPKALIKQVKNAHENGAGTGSLGWRYKWSEDIAKQAILRTHTTSVSARELAKLQPPAKVFCIGRVFRNESIDYKHMVEFTQIEGIVVDENVGFRDLLGYLKEFYQRMGFEKVRFRPSYFPYTEMSTEPELFFQERGEWIEMGGAGIFRPEMTKPLGIDVPVLAWGLGLERLIMLKLGLNDIRNFYYKNDLELLQEAQLWR